VVGDLKDVVVRCMVVRFGRDGSCLLSIPNYHVSI